MSIRCLFLLIFALMIGLLLGQPAGAEVTVDPFGVAVSVEDENISTTLTLTNHGDDEVAFSIDFDEVEEEEDQQEGPRRDPLEEGMFAVIQDGRAWNFLDEWMLDGARGAIDVEGFERLDLNDEGFGWHNYRNAGAWNDIEFENYNAIIYTTYGQSGGYIQAYNNNLERFEEYIANGGAAYLETGNPNQVPGPGGIRNDLQGTDAWGVQVVSPDPDDENYSRFAEICWESQNGGNNNLWEEGHRIQGSQWVHSGYSVGQFEDAVEDGTLEWYQVIAVKDRNRNQPGWVTYGIGNGVVFTSGHPTGHGWQWHQQPGRCGSMAEEVLQYLVEGGNFIRWFATDPEEGVIPGGEDVDVDLLFTPLDDEEFEDGVYELALEIELDDPEQPLISLTVFMSFNSPVANVSGTITDPSDNDAPIEGAKLSVAGYNFARFTNEDGEYSADNLPLGEYIVTVTADDFLPHTEAVNIEEAGDIEWNIELLHSECEIDPDEVEVAIEMEFETEVEFDVSNAGNGPLTYHIEKHLLGDADADPWELRENDGFDAQAEVEDTYLQGAVYIDGYYYMPSGNNRQDQNLVYIFDEEGNQVDQFDQFHQGRYGMREITWDGELLWGCDDNVIYGFTTDGDLRTSFEVPGQLRANPVHGIAFDSREELLWILNNRNNFYGFTRDGEWVAEIEREDDPTVPVYGMSYYPEDPDGFYMYLFARRLGGDEGGSNTQVHKLNTETGEIRFVVDLAAEGFSAGGLHITNELDIYSWVFIGFVQGGSDEVMIWQLDSRTGWMEVDINEGVIEPDESQHFILTLNSFDIPEAEFEGEIVFVHDGIGGETALSVTMTVTDQPVQTYRNLDLHVGWNMVSVNLELDDDDVEVVTQPLVDEGVLVLMKDSYGNFYAPRVEHNDIPGWSSDQGYLMKLSRGARLRVEGMSIVADTEIPLEAGWQMVSYYPRRPVEATLAFSGIVDDLVIAKDERGHFYVPEFGFSNLGLLKEGKGYQLNVTNDVNLVYVMEADDDEVASVRRQTATTPAYLPTLPATGANMSLLVTSDIDGDIGVYVSDRLVGSGRLENGVGGLAVWGDDPTTAEIDGALDSEMLEIRLFDGQELCSMSYTILKGDPVYHADGFLAVRLDGATSVPESFGIVSAYPNPFNAITRVNYTLSEAATVDLGIYDVSGRLVRELDSGHRQAGSYEITIYADDLPSGIYVIRLEAAGQLSQWKVALVK